MAGSRTPHDWRENWAERPRDESAATGLAHHDVAVCANGDVVSFHPAEPMLLIYTPDGSLRQQVPVPVVEGHGLTVVEHDGVECVWIADNGVKPRPQPNGTYLPGAYPADGQALLVTLDGEVLLRLPKPERVEYESGPYCPTSISVDEPRHGGNGDIWVADGYGQSLLHRFDANGTHVQTVTGAEAGGRLNSPHAIVIDRRRDRPELYVADRRNARLQVYGLDGSYHRTVGLADLEAPTALAISGDHLIVAEHRAARLTVLDRDDRYVEYLGRDESAPRRPGWPNALADDGRVIAPPVVPGLFNSPHGVAAAADGTLYVVEWLVGGRLIRLRPQLTDISGKAARNKQLVQEFFAAWTAGDFDRLAEMTDPAGEYWTVRSRSGIPLSDMVKRVRATQSETRDGLRFTVGTLTAEEDRVSVLLQGEGDFPGREHYLQLYHALIDITDGRVTRLALYYDTALSNRVMRGEGGLGPLPSHAPGFLSTET